jgi:hypothetical protein
LPLRIGAASTKLYIERGADWCGQGKNNSFFEGCGTSTCPYGSYKLCLLHSPCLKTHLSVFPSFALTFLYSIRNMDGAIIKKSCKVSHIPFSSVRRTSGVLLKRAAARENNCTWVPTAVRFMLQGAWHLRMFFAGKRPW